MTRHAETRRQFLAHTAGIAAATLATDYLAAPARAEDNPKRPRWQIGIYTRPWAAWDYRVALDAMAEAGYKYAGLMTTKSKKRLVIHADTTPEEALKIGEEAAERGLQIPSVYGGRFPVHESIEAGVAGLKRLIDNCAAAKAWSLLLGGIGSEKLNSAYYECVAQCCDYAAEKGVGLALKPHGGLNATGPQCRKAVERVGHKSFTLWYDPGNVYYYSEGRINPVEDAATVAGLVSGMCVKDFTMSEVDGKLKRRVDVTPGTGKVDFSALMKVLAQGGFTGGPLVIETLASGELAQTTAQAKKAREFVESQCRLPAP